MPHSPVLPRHHPIPKAGLPASIDSASVDSVRRFVRDHQFPSGSHGRYLFAFVDEEDRFQTVRLRHGLAGYRQPPALVRCAGGLHVLQLDAPAVNRIEYRFELIDHDGNSSQQCDPLSPLSVRDPFAEKSVVTTADYAEPDYVHHRDDVSPGSLHEIAIDGPIGKPWQTWIWKPSAVAHDADLPVILFLDGGDWLHLNRADVILRNLIHDQRIAPCRAVFVKPAARNEEYAANAKTAKYLASDLPKLLSEHVNWPSDSRHRVAVGCSLGALCLLHSHFTHSGAFGNLILQSGSYFQPLTDGMESGFAYFNAITKFVTRASGSASRSVTRIPIHMTAGLGEENLINNQVMAEALTRHGFALTLHQQPDAHNWTCWRDCIGDGLCRLLPASSNAT